MNKFLVRMATLCAVFLLVCSMNVKAYAGGSPEDEETTELVTETTVLPEPETVVPTENPFTPAGIATVSDNATQDDGKEFFTITTSNENVFYLIIDRQRDSENVYFLNAVTEQDLLALAEKSEETEESESAIPEILPISATENSPEPEPEEEKGGNPGLVVLLILILIGGGGAGWYLKVYLPKQKQAPAETEPEEDYYDEDDEPNNEDMENEGMEFWDLNEDNESEGDGL